MTLRRLQVSDFRCLQSTEFELDPRFTLVSGPNASGKSSLLEAIHILSRGRSFRTRHLNHVIRSGAERFVVYGEAEVRDRRVPLGVEGSTHGVRARMDGERVESLGDLAAALPVQVIDPEIHRLIEEGPSRRRRFLDWGVFHVEHDFLRQWRRYHQALKQRNAALKARQSRALVATWDAELLQTAESITTARNQYVQRLGAAAALIAQRLLGLGLALTYRPGWTKDLTMAEALAAGFGQDLESGITVAGPHRAEMVIRLNGEPVKDRISRGQQKLLAATLLLAQLELLPSDSGVAPVLLLDDPAAELDSDRLLHLIREVTQGAVQLVVTSLNPEFTAFGSPGRRFRLEAGAMIAI